MPGSGPAGWSAAQALGLSTQVAKRERIAVPARAPQGVGTVRFISRAAATKRRDERLRPTEVALFEVLRDWGTLVEVGDNEAAERVERLVNDGTLRLDRLVRASATEPPKVRERFRRLLGAIGRPEAAGTVRRARSASARHDPVLAA